MALSRGGTLEIYKKFNHSKQLVFSMVPVRFYRSSPVRPCRHRRLTAFFPSSLPSLASLWQEFRSLDDDVEEEEEVPKKGKRCVSGSGRKKRVFYFRLSGLVSIFLWEIRSLSLFIDPIWNEGRAVRGQIKFPAFNLSSVLSTFAGIYWFSDSRKIFQLNYSIILTFYGSTRGCCDECQKQKRQRWRRPLGSVHHACNRKEEGNTLFG